MSSKAAWVKVLPGGLRQLVDSRDVQRPRSAGEGTEVKQEVKSGKGDVFRTAVINRRCRKRITARLEDHQDRVNNSVGEGDSPVIVK